MKFKISRLFLLIGLIALTASSCQKDYPPIEELDEENIQAYIRQNNLSVTPDSTGYYYQVVTPGTGEAVKYSDKVFITFTLKTLDGRYVSNDEYVNNKFTNFLGYIGKEYNVPEAFRTAIKDKLVNKGGSIRLIIPSRLAYGRNETGGIPGNSSLDCVVTLHDVKTQAEFDELMIKKFARENNLNLTRDTSGLYYQIITPGTGTAVIRDTTEVSTLYKLRYLNGTTIQETPAGSPYKSVVNVNIQGYQIGVKLLKKGGKIRLLIPSALAYGSNTSSGIRANSILDYDVEVTEVKE